MYSFYCNKSPRRPVSAQSPHRLYNNDYTWPENSRSARCSGLRLTLRRRQICKNCTSQKIENRNLLHEIHWLETGVENMLKDKEAEVIDRVSKTMDDLYYENQRLKGKLLTEERVWDTSYTPFEKVDFVRERYHRSLDDNADLERKISEKENEVWDLKSRIQKKDSALKWFEEDLEKKENDVMKMKQRLLEVEFDNSGLRSALNKVTEECIVFSTRYHELTMENYQLKEELRDKRNTCFLSELQNKLQETRKENQELKNQLKEKENEIKMLKRQESKNLRDATAAEKRIEDLRKENTRLKTYFPNELHNKLQETRKENQDLKNQIKEKENENERLKRQESKNLRDTTAAEKRNEDLRKENTRLKTYLTNELHNKLQETRKENQELKNQIKEKEKENEMLKRQESKNLRDATAAEKRIEDLRKENTRLMQEGWDMELMLRKKESETTLSRRSSENKETELKPIQSNYYSNMEKEVIKKLKEDIGSKEKEIQRLLERVSTEERKYAQLQNRHLEDMQRKDSEMRKLLQKNQYLSDEMNLLISEKKQEEIVKKELDMKKEEIDNLQMRIRQLENRNIQLTKNIDPVSKDEHNLYARNSNAADEVKILQTELKGKQGEIQRMKEKTIQDKREIREMQEKFSAERNSLLQKNQRLENELSGLNAKIKHLEEYIMKTTVDLNHLKELKDTVANDNEKVKWDIATLSKEKDIALARYSDAEKEMTQLKLDIKLKGEKIQLLQKQLTQKEANNEKLQESLSNMAQEKQQLLERCEKVNSNDNSKLQLVKDESKRLQEEIRELLNKNSHLQNDIDDLCKQKEDALTRMRSLERVKSKCDDQLLLAKDESKRLQGKIRDLHGENNQLRRDIDDLAKQKEDALTRLSKVAGAKLTHGNAAITDLSDTDRPTKLAEKFSELYDNAWTDAFEELDNTFQNEEETIKVLLRIFQEAYTFCVLTENNYETRIGQAVFTLANETESRQITNTNVEIQKVLADLRISLSTACCSVVEEMLISKLPSIMKSVDVAACPLTKLFARQCASLSWKMRIRDPPLFVRFEFRCGSTFNSDVLKKYTKTGGYLDFLVWPTLYLHENGPVLAKGVAQPKIAP